MQAVSTSKSLHFAVVDMKGGMLGVINVNKIRKIITKVPITDQGCMLRGYSKYVVAHIVKESRKSTFIPMLAHKFGKSPVEIYVAHAARNAGESKYNVFSLAKLTLNLFKNSEPTEAELEKPKYEIREKIGF